MHISKRLLTAFLAAMLALCLCGCDSAAAPASLARGGQAQFDAYLESLLPEIVDTSTFDAGFLFLDPEEVGLEEPGSAFPWVSEEDWTEEVSQAQQILEDLEAFDPAKLNASSRATLELLRDVYTMGTEMSDFYMLAANDLGMESDAATLGITVAHAPYRSAADFDRLFAMYEDLDGTFRELIETERMRQEAGAGMTAAEIELAIREYERLLEGEPTAIQRLGDELIDGADFLSPAEKQTYHQKNEEAVTQHLLPAYAYLISSLREFPGRTGAPGLAGRMNGREFYELLLRYQGFDETPEELMHYLEEQVDSCLAEIESLVMEIEDVEALQAFLADPEAVPLVDADTPEGILEYLEAGMRSEFPVLETGEVDVVLTPEVLRNPEVVAYYVLMPLDQNPAQAKDVYINDEKTGADYSTLAHEGFPGHLYQDVYAALQDRSPVRRLLERGYTGATEGWGVYSEYLAADWVQDLDPVIARVAALSDQTDRLIMAWADIGVNYLGWTAAELAGNIEDTYGVAFEDAEELTNILAAMPATWVSYGVGGAKLIELRRQAEEALGDAFDPVAYHRAVLDVLPSDFSQIEAVVEAYISAAQAQQPGEEAA